MSKAGTRDPFWVLTEDQRLQEIIAAGGSPADAAAELNRSESAVANRARRLGISLKKKKLKRSAPSERLSAANDFATSAKRK